MCSLIFFYYSNIIYQFYITCMSLSCIIFYGSIISQNFSVFITMDRQAYLFYFNNALLWTIFWKVIRTIGPLDYWAFGLLGIRNIGHSVYRAFGLLDLRTIGPSDYWVDTVQVIQTDCQLIERIGYIDDRRTKVSANGQKNEQKLRRMYRRVFIISKPVNGKRKQSLKQNCYLLCLHIHKNIKLQMSH